MNQVKKSLYICIGVLLALLGVQALQSLWQVAALSSATQAVSAGAALSGDARQLWSRFEDAERAFHEATAFIDASGSDALRKDYQERAAGLRQQVAALRLHAQSGDLAPAVAGVSSAVDAWLALAAPHVTTEGVSELPSYHRLDEARARVEKDIGSLVEASAATAATSVASSQTTARTASIATLSVLVVAVALGFLLARQALRSLNRQLGADASEVARVVNAVADGDLTVTFVTDGLPEGSVMSAMARMRRALLDTVLRVQTISASLATGTHEIASGNHDLSQRTEQQAASLARTAATMDQLGTAVRLNADTSTQASELANSASSVATRGGSVVDQAAQNMRDIHESSRRIADIIGTIDGIAFQTNILALNAAVEAARAGEQGRGFAVVASEVRGLAQRSAAAAKEIKELIATSVDRVEAGTALANEAGRTIREVVEAIGRVNMTMGEIRNATVEQRTDVAQIGDVVVELDRTTQQNAALAEQSAAAAESLKTQGEQLVTAMSFFRIAAHA